MKIDFYIVSGMSGAGKSQTLNIFEDLGFVCIDNMPLQMMSDLVVMSLKNPSKYKKVAISIDSRAGDALKNFKNILQILKNPLINHKTIFLNCSDAALIRRFSETRRRHPLGKSVYKSIALERKMLKDVFAASDEIIDTSQTTMGELKKIISALAGSKTGGRENLNVSVLSFGYKYGLPSDADIVYDVRFLINPNYRAELRDKSGKDKAVKEYILAQKAFDNFFSLFTKLIESALPGYIDEGKSYLTIAIGCTGGRHRSVFTAEKLAHFLKSKKYKVSVNHRDIDKWKT